MEDIKPLLEQKITKLQEEKIYEDIANVENITEFLRHVLSNDMQLYFNAPDEQKEMIKGAYNRTMHIYKQILLARERLENMKK